MRRAKTLRRRICAAAASSLLVLAGQVAGVLPSAGPAGAAVAPVLQRGSSTVTADALPTVQIDGVVWSSTVIGNAVYAGGSFSHARPAGAAPGTSLVVRNNLLAFDITSGRLSPGFVPSLNAQARVVTRSPDASRIYVGGSFTTANGQPRYRIAAYSRSTGALISTFRPSLNNTVNSITATNSTVYVGGTFTAANGVARSRLAAFSASTGALLGWRPKADAEVEAVQLTPDLSRVIIGGHQQNINGASAYGLGSVSASTGALLPFAANKVVRDAGPNAAILSLRTDGTSILATGYAYGPGGNFEGVLSADPTTGAIRWLADCHGDSYDTFSRNGVVYVASHEHYCSNVGGFPDTNPRSRWQRLSAFTTAAHGTVQPNLMTGTSYGNFRDQPSPSLINWMPDLAIGTYTGQSQAAWSLSGNDNYVVAGGEFTKVNGVPQQGLVRFAAPSIAPRRQGPVVSGAGLAPTLAAASSTSVRVGWQADWDRDDQNLTYTVTRDGAPIRTVQSVSQFWNRPMIGIVDTGLTAGSTHSYRVSVTDPTGNAVSGDTATIALPGTDPPALGAYASAVIAAGARHYWRLDGANAAAGGTDVDRAGYDDLRLGTSTLLDAPGAIVGDGDAAAAFDGTAASAVATTHSTLSPTSFSVSCWFATTSTAGGVLVSWGNASTGLSPWADRQLVVDPTGHVAFSVERGSHTSVRSPATYADGSYHQAVATLSAAGMALYVDGRLVASRATPTLAVPFDGYWRIGGDRNMDGGAAWFTGRIDEVAIGATALSAAQVQQQYAAAGR